MPALEKIKEVITFIIMPKYVMEKADIEQNIARDKLSNTLKDGRIKQEKEDTVTNLGDSAMKALLEGFLNDKR